MVYYDDVKDKVRDYSRMPLKYKKEKLDHVQLFDLPPGQKLQRELMVEHLYNDINQFPFLYDNKQFLLIDNL